MKMWALLLLLLPVGACAHSVGVGEAVPEEELLTYLVDTPVRIYPPLPIFITAWEDLQQCVRPENKKDVTFEDLEWWGSSGIVVQEDGRKIIGLFHEPNRIFLDRKFIHYIDLLKHEIMHYLLINDSNEVEDWYKCIDDYRFWPRH
jgi:hypothetical protein